MLEEQFSQSIIASILPASFTITFFRRRSQWFKHGAIFHLFILVKRLFNFLLFSFDKSLCCCKKWMPSCTSSSLSKNSFHVFCFESRFRDRESSQRLCGRTSIELLNVEVCDLWFKSRSFTYCYTTIIIWGCRGCWKLKKCG